MTSWAQELATVIDIYKITKRSRRGESPSRCPQGRRRLLTIHTALSTVSLVERRALGSMATPSGRVSPLLSPPGSVISGAAKTDGCGNANNRS